MDSLRRVLRPAPPPTPPITSVTTTSSPTMVSSPMAKPAPFSGVAKECNGFLLQCSLALEMQPHLYPTERSKIAFMISLLSGRVLQWAETIWTQSGNVTQSFNQFIIHFREVFGRSTGDSTISDQLYHLRQGSRSISEYALHFRTLAAASGWNERSLITTYRQGLEPRLRLQLATYDDSGGLEHLIQLSVRCATRMQSCYEEQPFLTRCTPFPHQPVSVSPPEPVSEPMQTDSAHLSFNERQRRISQGLCLYCGAGGHIITTCPVRPPRMLVSTINPATQDMKPLSTIVNLTVLDISLPVHALLDSGSTGNFISGDLCRQLKIPTTTNETTYQVHSVTGKPLTRGNVRLKAGPVKIRIGLLHKEQIHLLVLEGATTDIILGRPWFVQHEPQFSWRSSEVLKWGKQCFPDCFPYIPHPPLNSAKDLNLNSTSIESPLERQSIDIPACYAPFRDVFCPKKAAQLPPHRPWDCAINHVSGEPVPRGRIYPLSLPEQKAMEEYIEEALKQGYIRPSTSPAASSFFFVAKKDGGLRPCIDYRALNEITIKFHYPLPLIPAALEHLCGATIFTKLDLRSAYNLIRIREGDEWKTAFVTPTGHYEYLVMPYGLVNAPSVFQDFMHEVLREFLHRFVLVYIDDILIYSRSMAEHRHHVAEVLQCLRDFHLFLKAEKCSFHQSSVQFLGYNIDSSGIRMDEWKVEAIRTWPTPSTIKELQRFLGFSNFYRRFIQNYSTITSPLTSLLRNKPKSLSWSPAATEAFEGLQEAFTSAPILVHPDPQKPFIVEVDASTSGVGAVLSQQQGNPAKLHPCAFFSRKLSPVERNYDIGNRELLSIKLALEEWRHWLEGAQHPFIVLTDHKNLQYLRDAKRLNPRQARWALFFTRFNFTISYRPGPKNIKADALSRLYTSNESEERPVSILPAKIIISPIQWNPDPETPAKATTATPPGCPPGLHYVPRTQHTSLIHSAHSSLGTGHPGANNTLSLLKNRYWWPNMARDVRRFVKGCVDCAISKSPRHLPAGKLLPLPIPNRPWSHLGVDFVTDLPASDGNTCILVVIDHFSKACRLISLKGLPTAMETAELMFNHIFRDYGIPEDIVSDRGPQFVSRVWKTFFSLLGVTISLSSGYHPQTNGQTERKIQEIGRFLRTFCHGHQESWNQFIGWAEYAQNSLRQPSTGLTPFQCLLGYQPPLFPWSGEPSDVPSVDYWFRESERVWDTAHHQLQRAVRRCKMTADLRRSEAPQYQPGQRVWLSTRDIRLRLPCKKLSPRFVGPFKITKQINPVTYQLQLPTQYKIHSTFHVSLLKLYHSPVLPSTEPGPSEEPPLPLILDDGTIYKVKEILDSRRRGGWLEYLVDWEGYGPEERSWIPRGDILDPTLLEDFHANHPDRPAPRGRGRPPRRRGPRPSGAGRGGGGGNVMDRPGFHNNQSQRTPSPEF